MPTHVFKPATEPEKVIAHRGGHLQVIVCAEAGKTEPISCRVSSLIEEASSQLEGAVSPFSNTERQSRVP